MDVVFHRQPGRAYYALAQRRDGVTIHLRGGSYNPFDPPLPHDIAHLVVESGLRLEHGVWGLLDAGGLFRLATVHAGRRKPNAAKRAEELLDRHREDLNVAEVAVAAVCRLVHERLPLTDRTIRAMTGQRHPPSLTPEAVPPIGERLHAAARQWAQVPVGGTLALTFDPR
jgi:hypothetical protein